MKRPARHHKTAAASDPSRTGRRQEPAAAPTEVDTLRERIGNRAFSNLLGGIRPDADPRDTTAALPQHMRQALASPAQPWPLAANGGQPVAPPLALVHRGPAAERSARLLGAHAYQAGAHVVFGANQWRPHTVQGRALIAHEFAHVVQTQGRLPTHFGIAPAGHASEVRADRHARATVQRGEALAPEEPLIHLTRDPRLSGALDAIRNLPVPLTPQGAATRIAEVLQGIDLSDPDNLQPVIQTINEHFDPAERAEILPLFLGSLDRALPARPQPSGPSPEEEARMERQLDMMRIRPRGPYGQYGPGVLLPVLSQPARHLLPLLHALEGGLDRGGAFASGLLTGLADSMPEADRVRLAGQLVGSSVVNLVFSPIFASGAVVGVVEDVVDTVKSLYETITNFSEVLAGIGQMIELLMSEQGVAVARSMGEEIGRSYGQRIVQMSRDNRDNIVGFTFDLGRLVGPTVIYTVLAFLGVPELMAAAVIGRLLNILRPLLQRFPRLLRLLNGLARRMGAVNAPDALDTDLDRAFARTFDQPTEALPRGGPTTQPPEVAHGFQARHLAAFARVMGRRFDDPRIADLARIWRSVENPGEVASLSLSNSRRLFNNHRNRFWRAVRDDAAARQLFTDAGMVFEGGPTSAPFYRRADGSVFRMTIDHVVERQSAPGRALDPGNLQLSSTRENTVLLRQLHDQDPFLRAPPPPN
jgi:hypothetical protein